MPEDQGRVHWLYAVDNRDGFETRAEAAAEAAIINRERDDRRRDVVVWSYPVCDCEEPQKRLIDAANICAVCGVMIP